MDHGTRCGAEPEPDRQAPGRRGANRHQQVHVAGAGAQGVPTGFVETRAQQKLDRAGQQALQPGRQHDRATPGRGEPGGCQVQQHWRHQRQRQRQAPGDRAKASPGRWAGHQCLTVRSARFIAGIPDGASQAHIGLGVTVVADTCRLGGQVDTGHFHAGHRFERALHPQDTGGAGHAVDTKVQCQGR